MSFHVQVLGAAFSAGIAGYLVYGPRGGVGQAFITGFSMNIAGMSHAINIAVESETDQGL